MDISYPTDNINNMIRAVKGTEWLGKDFNNMVELGYTIMHGDFSDDNLMGVVSCKPYQFCNIPSRYINYSTGKRLGGKNKDIIHYFRIALDFIINYIKEFWHEILQKLNNTCYRDTWMYKEFIKFVEENKDKYPEHYLEMKLL